MIRNDELIEHFYTILGNVVDEMLLGNIVGIDRLYKRVCRCLTTEHQVRIIGLCGVSV